MTYKEYRSQARSDLAKYNRLKHSVSVLEKQIERARNDDLYRAPTPSRIIMGSVASDNKFARYVARIESLESQLRYDKLYLANIDNALDMLMPKEKELLFGFYINRQRGSVNRMLAKDYTERSWLYRKAQKALDRYMEYYFGLSVKDMK